MSGMSSASSVEVLTTLFRAFVENRGWRQFDTARSLVFALVDEIDELAAEFLRLSDRVVDDSLRDTANLDVMGSELIDVFNDLPRFSNVVGIDLVEEPKRQLAINENRYPADRAQESAAKPSAYG